MRTKANNNMPLYRPNGYITPAGLGFNEMLDPLNSQGKIIPGVVIAVYEYDTQETFNNSNQTPITNNTLRCDVLTYGKRPSVLHRVMITTPSSSAQAGMIRRPRAASQSLNGADFDLDTNDVMSLDGDHVLVCTTDNDLNEKYVIAYLSHPSGDKGNQDKDIGYRTRLKGTDPDVWFYKYNGSFYGIDGDGNFIVDTTEATSGGIEANGTQPTPTLDGTNGNVTINVPEGSVVTIRLADGNNLRLEGTEAGAVATFGDGAVPVAVASHLQTLYENLKAEFDAFHAEFLNAQVQTVFGPSSTIQFGSGLTTRVAPTYDPNINSNHLAIPDTDR